MSVSVIDLVIKTINNEIYNYTVELDSTILSLKTLIRETTSIDEERQRLIYKGRVLTDETIINDYKIENGHTIHMVARPTNYQQLRAQSNATESSNTTSSNTTLLAAGRTSSVPIVATTSSSTDNAGGETLEHIRQGLLSIHTLISTMDPRDFRQSRMTLTNLNSSRMNVIDSTTNNNNNNRTELLPYNNNDKSDNSSNKFDCNDVMDVDSPTNDSEFIVKEQEKQFDNESILSEGEMEITNSYGENSSSNNIVNRSSRDIDDFQISAITRKFFKGQWVDVKDTVSQWLEATVMDINHEESKIFVHYNGWPERWDEWISWDSPRISPFRSRTNHSTLNPFSSPTPNVLVATAPSTGPNDLRLFLSEFAQLFQTLSPLMEEIATLAEDSFSSRPIVGNTGISRPSDAASSSSRNNLRYRGSSSNSSSVNNNAPESSVTNPIQSMASGMPWESVVTRFNNSNTADQINLENERRQKLKCDNNELNSKDNNIGLSRGIAMNSQIEDSSNLPNTKVSSSYQDNVKSSQSENNRNRENRKRNVDTVDSFDSNRKQYSKKSVMMSDQQKEARLSHLAKELCPLVDRFGRVLTDLSPLLRDLAEVGNQANPSAIPVPALSTENAPLSLEASLMSLLRNRPPSPPSERSYRAPIAIHPRIPVTSGIRAGGLGLGLGIGTNASTGTSGFLSELIGSAISNSNTSGSSNSLAGVRSSDGGHHVDIHIAILQPQSRTTTTTDGSGLSQAVSSLTASLQAQAQSLAQRTQELSERTQAVSGYSSALNEMLRIVHSDEQRIEEINSQIRAIQANSENLDTEEESSNNENNNDNENTNTSNNQMDEDEDDEHLNTGILNDLIPPENEERNNQSLLSRTDMQTEPINLPIEVEDNSIKDSIESSPIENNESRVIERSVMTNDSSIASSSNIIVNNSDNNVNSNNTINNSTNTSQRQPSNTNAPAINPPSVLERLRRSFNFGP